MLVKVSNEYPWTIIEVLEDFHPTLNKYWNWVYQIIISELCAANNHIKMTIIYFIFCFGILSEKFSVINHTVMKKWGNLFSDLIFINTPWLLGHYRWTLRGENFSKFRFFLSCSTGTFSIFILKTINIMASFMNSEFLIPVCFPPAQRTSTGILFYFLNFVEK